jgi:hypothetical protein
MTAAAAVNGGGGAAQQPQGTGGRRACAHFAAAAASDASSDDESEAEPSEADRRLDAVLLQYDGVALDGRLLQQLATRQMNGCQAADGALDVVTGFHLVDGHERIVVLEVPRGGCALPPHLVPPPAAKPDAAAAAVAQQQQQQQLQSRAASKAGSAAGRPALKGSKQVPAAADTSTPLSPPPPSALENQPPQPPAWRGGLEVLSEIAAWALEERRPCPEEKWRERRVLLHPGAVHPVRLYAEFGVGLWTIKLRAGLEQLGAEAASYTSGRVRGRAHMQMSTCISSRSAHLPASSLLTHSNTTHLSNTPLPEQKVRPECVSGLTRLLALRHAEWARRADSLLLWPSAAQLKLVDKKFGGELTKGDVLGVEAEEEEESSSEEEDGEGGPRRGRGSPREAAAAGSGGGGGASSVRSGRSGRSGSCRSRSRSRRRRSRGSSKGARRHKRRFRPSRLPPLDVRNEAFLHRRAEAQRARAARDLTAINVRALAARAASDKMRRLQAAWASWNPQRAAARELERRAAAGEITLQVGLWSVLPSAGCLHPSTARAAPTYTNVACAQTCHAPPRHRTPKSPGRGGAP